MNILSQIYTTFSDLFRSWLFFRHKKAIVTLLGSARFSQNNIYCQKAFQISRGLAEKGYAIITGSGFGVMESASRGARDAKGLAMGCSIESIEPVNQYINQKIALYSFVARQRALIEHSKALIIFPGGFGTLSELLDCLVLIQNKQKAFSLFLIGRVFWEPLMQYFKHTLLENKTIDAGDLESICITDCIEDVLSQMPDLSMTGK